MITVDAKSEWVEVVFVTSTYLKINVRILLRLLLALVFLNVWLEIMAKLYQ